MPPTEKLKRNWNVNMKSLQKQQIPLAMKFFHVLLLHKILCLSNSKFALEFSWKSTRYKFFLCIDNYKNLLINENREITLWCLIEGRGWFFYVFNLFIFFQTSLSFIKTTLFINLYLFPQKLKQETRIVIILETH